MRTYAGTCKGGPMDGQRLAHHKRSYAVVTPAIVQPGVRVRVKEGEYRWDESTVWSFSPFWRWVPGR